MSGVRKTQEGTSHFEIISVCIRMIIIVIIIVIIYLCGQFIVVPQNNLISSKPTIIPI